MTTVTRTFDSDQFVLAPCEPTPAMSAAGFIVSEGAHDPAAVYRAMIAASPPAGDTPGAESEVVAWRLTWPSGNAELHFVGAGREWVENRASITIAEDGPATIAPLYTHPHDLEKRTLPHHAAPAYHR